jgi:hypothetical protein
MPEYFQRCVALNGNSWNFVSTSKPTDRSAHISFLW